MKKQAYKTKVGVPDIAVIAAAIIIGILPLALRHGGNTVAIKYNGITQSYPLSDDRVVNIDSGTYSLTLEIKDGCVRVTDSDCTDRQCVRHGAASRAGDTIVCVPAGVIVQISGEEDSDAPDAVAGKAG